MGIYIPDFNRNSLNDLIVDWGNSDWNLRESGPFHTSAVSNMGQLSRSAHLIADECGQFNYVQIYSTGTILHRDVNCRIGTPLTVSLKLRMPVTGSGVNFGFAMIDAYRNTLNRSLEVQVPGGENIIGIANNLPT